MGFATESWLLLPPQIHSEGPVLFVAPQIILSFSMSWYHLRPAPIKTNQPTEQTSSPSLPRSILQPLFFFSCFLIFSLIDFFMELKLSKGKFLQNSTQRYPIMNSLTVGSIIWWNQVPGEIVRGQSSELFKAHWAKSWNVRLQECHTFGQMGMKKMNREDLFSLSLVFLYAEFCSSS